MKDSILTVKNLTKTYQKRDQRTGQSEDFNAISDISLDIFKDEILGVGRGSSKKRAQQSSAKEAIEKLDR
jgi:ABC-type oligopeptide transport system ATPase subunit